MGDENEVGAVPAEGIQDVDAEVDEVGTRRQCYQQLSLVTRPEYLLFPASP
jgi:hypothetical protein